jgi:adenylate kinase family enzyme
MTDYDFKSLNDKEFEIFCADLLSEVENIRFERFKAGKDEGVDGRFFNANDEEIILQVKHRPGISINQLIKILSETEKPKIEILDPIRYVLAVSSPLSRKNKTTIFNALYPHIKSESDIYGKEDLNDLLRKYPHIEKNHYKLWINSTNVLSLIINHGIYGRSEFSAEQIIKSSNKYVVTKNHASALDLLERYGVLIIIGDPGVGKTTLAEQLCLHYIANGFEYFNIIEDIHQAESTFNSEKKQLFYFDDFLGRLYLEALNGHEGNRITQFMRRIASHKNKRFILTSRTTILNQGKILIDSFDHNNLHKNEYKLHIQNLSELDKAQILYNHIWHSNLENEYIDQLYFEKRYHKIIKHKNFNPRLISYITDSSRVTEASANDYWQYIVDSLNDPSMVWENPFIAQQDDFGRSLIILVVLNGGPMDENLLRIAYQKYISLPENQYMNGRGDFLSNIKLLAGSFLTRTTNNQSNQTNIDLFNPSIGDYILSRYQNDEQLVRNVMSCLNTQRSLLTLRSFSLNKYISKSQLHIICKHILRLHSSSDFLTSNPAYIAYLCNTYLDFENPINDYEKAAINFISTTKDNDSSHLSPSIVLVQRALDGNVINCERAIRFIENHYREIKGAEDISIMSDLISMVIGITKSNHDLIGEFSKYVIRELSRNINDYFDLPYVLSDIRSVEHERAKSEVIYHIEETLKELKIPYKDEHVFTILANMNIMKILDANTDFEFYEYYDWGSDYDDSPELSSSNEIDDLFERE